MAINIQGETITDFIFKFTIAFATLVGISVKLFDAGIIISLRVIALSINSKV